MAHLNSHFTHGRRPSFIEGIGQKVKSAAEVAATLKGIYDVGKVLYNGAMAIRPAIQAASVLI
jgi:hypothetical protein